jgi:hypothetical protein
LPESNWRNKKLEETQDIIEACAALFTKQPATSKM